LANVAQQQQMGQTNRNYQDTATTIAMAKDNADKQYQQSSAALVTQKNQSLNQAQQDFTNKLLQISQSRAQNEQAKGQARLQALQDLRNSVNQINLQNTQFQQTLEAQKQASDLQLQNYQATGGASITASNNAVSGFNNNIANTNYGSGLGVGGSTGTATAQPLTGYTSKQQDPLTGAISLGGNKYDAQGNIIY
jgi:hypothetical protein